MKLKANFFPDFTFRQKLYLDALRSENEKNVTRLYCDTKEFTNQRRRFLRFP